MKRYTAAELAFVKRRKKMPRRELLLAFRRKFRRRRDMTLLRLQDLCNRKGWSVGSLKGRTKGRARRYSKAELAFIKRRRKMPRRELHVAFVEKFRRGDVSCDKIKQLCKRNGWSNDRAGSRAKKGHTKFSKAELAFIRRRRETPRAKLHAEFVEEFGRPMTFGAFRTFCKKWGVFTGRTGKFEQGHVPWTQGKKLPYNANSARTRFKKGQRPHNSKPAGHEWRHSRYRYTIVSVEGTNPHTGGPHRHALKHRLLWEKQFGPLPEGMVLKCKGDLANADPANWEAVPRGVLPRLNGKASRGRNYDKAPDELKPTIMAVARLEHRLHEKAGKPAKGASA